MHDRFDLVVVGGGIVGVAAAAAALDARPGVRIAVVEQEPELASHQTGRNSGVIHSGLYYKPGSAKARLCVGGAARMLAFCRAEGVAHGVVGKIVVATREDELPRMDELLRRGEANGVPGLRRLDADGLRGVEPHATGLAAIHVPGTAIADYRGVVERLAARVRAGGGEVRTGVRVHALRDDGSRGVRVETGDGTLLAGAAIACAGLWADRLAARSGARPSARIVPFRGEYWSLRDERAHLVRGLVYPVPDPRFPFLGVHLTRTLDGGVHCGPNAVLAWRRDGYTRGSFSMRDALGTLGWPGFWRMAARHARTGLAESWRAWSVHRFAEALRRLCPDLRDEDLVPAEAGVRAQALERDGTLVDDFRFEKSGRVLHVLNAPSPAATASLAIADELVEHAARDGLLGA